MSNLYKLIFLLQFRRMGLLLFERDAIRNQHDIHRQVYSLRAKLYDELSAFFPEAMTPPKISISELVPL